MAANEPVRRGKLKNDISRSRPNDTEATKPSSARLISSSDLDCCLWALVTKWIVCNSCVRIYNLFMTQSDCYENHLWTWLNLSRKTFNFLQNLLLFSVFMSIVCAYMPMLEVLLSKLDFSQSASHSSGFFETFMHLLNA